MPKIMILDVVFRSSTGRSLLEKDQEVTVEELSQYSATEQTIEESLKILRELGFELVGAPTRFGISIAGSEKLVHKVFGVALTVPVSLEKWIEAVRIPPQVEFYPSE